MTKISPEVYSVVELNRSVRDLLAHEFGAVWVAGELSNISRPQSGHFYFTLKDDKAQIRCAFFRRQNAKLNFNLVEGQQVLLLAEVSLYEARGDYQLIVQHMEESGDGALRRAFELLKQKLEQEGLFDQAHKQTLPELPRGIGVISSPSGAAIKDVLSVLGRRFPMIPIVIYPAQVQGAEAISSLIRAIELANQRQEVEVLLLCRGGGALEDLNAFNDEKLARALFASQLPVVSGIGHEVDFTIADFVVDQRAPTPSVAAELVVPNQAEYLDYLCNCEQSLRQILRRYLDDRAQKLDFLSRRLRDPSKKVKQDRQRLTALWRQCIAQIQLHQAALLHQVQEAQSRVHAHHPQQKLQLAKISLQGLRIQLNQLGQHQQRTLQGTVAGLAQQLHTLSPLNTLARGYAIARDAQGKALTNSDQVALNDAIEIQLAAGNLQCKVQGKQK